MRDFVILSESGMGLPAALQLEHEGAKCAFYIHEKEARECGDGLLKGGRLQEIEQIKEMPKDTIVIIEGMIEEFADATKAIKEWGYAVYGGSYSGFGLCGSAARQFTLAEKLEIPTGKWKPVASLDEFRRNDGNRTHSVFPDRAHPFMRRDERYPGEMLGIVGDHKAECDIVMRAGRAPIRRHEMVGWFNGIRMTTSLVRDMIFDNVHCPTRTSRSLFYPTLKPIGWFGFESTLKKSGYVGPVRLRFADIGGRVFDGLSLSVDVECEMALARFLRKPYSEWLSTGMVAGVDDECAVSTVRMLGSDYQGEATVRGKIKRGTVGWVSARAAKKSGIETVKGNGTVAIVMGFDSDARTAEHSANSIAAGVYAPCLPMATEALCVRGKELKSIYPI